MRKFKDNEPIELRIPEEFPWSFFPGILLAALLISIPAIYCLCEGR